MSLHSLIENGGKVLVVGGQARDWAKFEHPQIIFWSGDQKEIARQASSGLPDNVRGLIVSRFVSHRESVPLMAEIRKRRGLLIMAGSDGEIKEKLTQIIGEKKMPEPQEASPEKVVLRAWHRGEQKQFVESKHRAEGTISAEAHRLFTVATLSGIKTTENGMAQAVGLLRKKLGIAIGTRAGKGGPKQKVVHIKKQPEVNTVTEFDEALKMIEDAIAGLSLIREKIHALKNRDIEDQGLKAKLRKMLEE